MTHVAQKEKCKKHQTFWKSLWLHSKKLNYGLILNFNMYDCSLVMQMWLVDCVWLPWNGVSSQNITFSILYSILAIYGTSYQYVFLYVCICAWHIHLITLVFNFLDSPWRSVFSICNKHGINMLKFLRLGVYFPFTNFQLLLKRRTRNFI
jgi:hypothetical protein